MKYIIVTLVMTLCFGSTSLRAMDDDFVIEEGQLNNGLKIYVIPDDRADVVTHMLWIKVGGADDPRGKSGMAHLFEHLMFKGTEANPDGTFDTRIEQVGGNLNAFTGKDATAYYEEVSSRHLGMVMDLEADRFMGLTLSVEDVETEAQVVVQERLQRVENQPAALLNEVMNAQLFTHHAYGVPLGGWTEEIESISREDALSFYQQYYYPANAFVIVAGNTNLNDVMALAKKSYGALTSDEIFKPRQRVSEPEPIAPRNVTFHDPRVQQPFWQRSYLTPTSAQSNDTSVALDILAEILGGGRTSRLFTALVLDQKKALHVGSFYNGGALDYGQFKLYGVPRDDISLEEIEQLAIDQINKIIQDGVTETELERAKRQLLASVIYGRDSVKSLAYGLGFTLTTGGTVDMFLTWPDKLRAVTAEDVRLAAEHYLTPSRSVSGFLLRQNDPEQNSHE